MMDFNFSDVNVSRKYLRPWCIYHGVRFSGISDVITGASWRAWDFEFSCADGIYIERIFQPKENDVRIRRDLGNGRVQLLPSAMERILYFASSLLSAYVPELMDQFSVYVHDSINTIKDTSKQFDLFMSKLGEFLRKSDRSVDLLLIGRSSSDGRVYASLPRFVRVSKDGDCYLSERFIGNDLHFSQYELRAAEAYHSLKPTLMSSSSSSSGSNIIEDFEKLI